jgi:hypothetical protein
MVAIEVVRGDITQENVDAIVTAANHSLHCGAGAWRPVLSRPAAVSRRQPGRPARGR